MKITINYDSSWNKGTPIREKYKDMNLKRIHDAIRNCPRGNNEELMRWVKENPILSEDEKRTVFSIAQTIINRTEVIIPKGYLEDKLVKLEGENKTKFLERSSSFVIESFMCSNYKGFLKYLLCSIDSHYRRETYNPEVLESDGTIIDFLTGREIPVGEIYYNLKSKIGDEFPLTEDSFDTLKRSNLILKRTLGPDYLYNQ